MLRMANPGSDISNFIRIYTELYEALGSLESFRLDDISYVLVGRNLATSSGYMGEQALARSTRKDRSRDPLYNQSKMYSELYKVLGWLHPLPDSALTFQFTYLGAHVREVQTAPGLFFRECLLGLVYPNAILTVSNDYALRPFATILRTMDELDGMICRDEIIIGPLCLRNDRDDVQFSVMIENLRSMRGNWVRLQQELNTLSLTRRITKQTAENYTRFPIAALKWTNWANDERRKDIYGKPIPFLVLTNEGRRTITTIASSKDIRATDLSNANEPEKAALVRTGFYQMLGRAGFDLSPVSDQLLQDSQQVERFLGKSNTPIMFSPFQELDPAYTKSLFSGSAQSRRDITQNPYQNTLLQIIPTNATKLFTSSKVTLGFADELYPSEVEGGIADLFYRVFENTRDINEAINEIAKGLKASNRDSFYPLVASLFRALGYTCQVSRPGVNYERWDAFISHPSDSIPIEIKSPSEEEFISVKAVRQALENKIVLLARGAFPSRFRTTSLVVGYNLPNDRSEVSTVIDNIYAAYDIVIGIIDIRSLLRLVAAKVLEGKAHNSEELINLRGIINVSYS